MEYRKYKKNPLLQKLNGYQKAPKNRFYLLFLQELTQEELVLFELGIAITDWDKRHTDTFGSFYATNGQLAEVLGSKSDSSISRPKTSLIEKGYFILREDGRIEPKDFQEWELRKREYYQGEFQ